MATTPEASEQKDVQTPGPTPAPAAPSPTIMVSDLQLMLVIIDVGAKRGVFSGDELLEVGQLRKRLQTFIAAVTNVPAPTAPVTPPPAVEKK